MNNVSFYFRASLNTEEYAFNTLNKLYLAAAEKFVACCAEFRMFHARTDLACEVDLKICQVVYVVIRSFFKYLVCNVARSVFAREHYHRFFSYSLKFFEMRFANSRNYFGRVHAILLSKLRRLENEKTSFAIN